MIFGLVIFIVCVGGMVVFFVKRHSQTNTDDHSHLAVPISDFKEIILPKEDFELSVHVESR